MNIVRPFDMARDLGASHFKWRRQTLWRLSRWKFFGEENAVAASAVQESGRARPYACPGGQTGTETAVGNIVPNTGVVIDKFVADQCKAGNTSIIGEFVCLGMLASDFPRRFAASVAPYHVLRVRLWSHVSKKPIQRMTQIQFASCRDGRFHTGCRAVSGAQIRRFPGAPARCRGPAVPERRRWMASGCVQRRQHAAGSPVAAS